MCVETKEGNASLHLLEIKDINKHQSYHGVADSLSSWPGLCHDISN